MKQYTVNGKTIVFGTFEELNVPKGHLCYTAVTQDLINKDIYYIAYDRYFTKLSPTSQKFLIYHELGHIENGDFEINIPDINKMNLYRIFGITNKVEFKADEFAINKNADRIDSVCNSFMESTNDQYFVETSNIALNIFNSKRQAAKEYLVSEATNIIDKLSEGTKNKKNDRYIKLLKTYIG